MNLNQYVDAIKKTKKRSYLMPFLILMYIMIIFDRVTTASNFGMGALFLPSAILLYLMYSVQIIFYPYSKYFIAETWIYKMIFGDMPIGKKLQSKMNIYFNIGKDIPDDVYLWGSSGNSYRIGSHYRSKADRTYRAKADYLFFTYLLFVFKDCILRIFVCLGIFITSPLIFLFAVPIVRKSLRKSEAFENDLE